MIGLGSCLILWLAGWSFLPGTDFPSPATVDTEMVRWAASRVPASLPAERRLVLLHRALVQRGGLDLEISGRTSTARQAFAERRANCVSFAHLYVGLARRLGLPVYFLLARGIAKQGRQRDLRVLEGHMAVGYGEGVRALAIDLDGVRRTDFRRFEKVGDPVAEAVFYSNVGVEALLDGSGRKAVVFLEKATEQAPELAPLWANLGVARRRAGDLPGAALAIARAQHLGATPLMSP